MKKILILSALIASSLFANNKTSCDKYLEKADDALSYIEYQVLTQKIVVENYDPHNYKKDGGHMAQIANAYLDRYKVCINTGK